VIDQGQGGSQSIEDAEALAVALENVSPGDVPKQLKKVEKIRYDRASFVQHCSRQMAHGPGVDDTGKQRKLEGYKFAEVSITVSVSDA
jgi:2-polyprenyl-6-methoxyphenol hydroxylase-like FAD-dependent oxidoreductase